MSKREIWRHFSLGEVAKSRQQAIKAKCWDCCGLDSLPLECGCDDCPLYPHRPKTKRLPPTLEAREAAAARGAASEPSFTKKR